MPGISIGEVQKLLQVSDRTIGQFPEVDHVLGKAGRAETSTDPAPLSMLETVITLKPASAWRRVPTWYSSWAPAWAASLFRHVTPGVSIDMPNVLERVIAGKGQVAVYPIREYWLDIGRLEDFEQAHAEFHEVFP